MKSIMVNTLAAISLLSGCGSNDKKKDQPQPQVYLAEPEERSVVIDRGEENERKLIVRSRFPAAPSNHGDADGSSSIAFLDFAFTPHREGESAGAVTTFYVRIGNNSFGKGYDSDEGLALDYHNASPGAALTPTPVLAREAPYRFVMMDFYFEEYKPQYERDYFHRIADHRSVTLGWCQEFRVRRFSS